MIKPETWYATFAAYNTAMLPVLIISWIALVVCTVLLFTKPSKKTNTVMKVCLAFVFAWNGVVFFFMYMKSSAIPGGIPMVLISILFLVDVFRNKITFKLPDKKWHKYLTLSIVVWALGLYTIVGWLTGHPYPNGPILMAPCPSTIFTIALLSTALPIAKIDKFLFTFQFVLLLWWSFFSGLGAPLAFSFYLDFTLGLTGLYGLVMLIRNWLVKA